MNGDREEAFFFGAGARRLFGVLHRPDGRPRRAAGWLLLAPLGAEGTNSHRMMFEFARALAREGFDVLRFDYRGSGESAGLAEEFTFEDQVADAESAAEELERRAGVPCRGMLGLRLGAAVAAAAAESTGRDPVLVMWEPVTDGARYCGDLLRAAMANEFVGSGAAPRTRAELEQSLLEGRTVPVDGHPLARGMFQSIATIDLLEGGRPTAAPVLIVQIEAGAAGPPRDPLRRLAGKYALEGGAAVETVRAPPIWYRVKECDWRPAELFGKTLEWIRANSGPPRRPRSRPTARARGRRLSPADGPNPGAADGPEERPVAFSVLGERVRGMAHLPRALDGGVPAVVMLAAGESCRTSLFYVPLARRLARDGWPVLRFDPRGIGDSDGDTGCATLAEVFRMIQAGGLVPDTVAALDFLERDLGIGTSVLTGLCGGAITAAYAADDPRVVGIAPLELRLEFTPLPRFRFAGTAAQYLSWAQIAAASRRAPFLLGARRILHSLRAAARRARARVARIVGRAVRGGGPGSDEWFFERLGPAANVGMIRALGRALDRGVPTLCVFGDTDAPRLFDAILPGLLEGGPDRGASLERRVIAGADHNFVAGGSTERLMVTLAAWLASRERPWPAPARARERREAA